MAIPTSCDVVVIGGGPGGALAATYLAQAGYHAVLLERQHHPRYAVGESLIPDFWKYCAEAGVAEAIAAEGFIRKAGGIVEWDGRRQKIAFADYGYERPALHVERDRFDELLAANARGKGAQLFEGVPVTRVDLDDAQRPVVHYRMADAPGQIACRYVIDASGQSAMLGRQLGVRRAEQAFRFMSVWGYFEGSDYLTGAGEICPAAQVAVQPPVTYVTNLPALGDWGWSWHIMLRRTTSVGLVVPVSAVKQVRGGDGAWETFFHDQIARLPLLARLLRPARFVPGSVRLIHNYAYRSERLAGPGYFLIGDAGGFIDPIFSIGVVLAMYGAWAAAWAIDHCLRAPGEAAAYQALFAQQVQARLELARALALPGYDAQALADPQAQAIARLTSDRAQALLHAASNATARSHNLAALLQQP